jgi:ABC-type nitrate/sulfonate/bicarbonate transport system substrate-binding protein
VLLTSAVGAPPSGTSFGGAPEYIEFRAVRQTVVVALLLAFALAGCGGGGEETPETLDIGYSFGADIGDVGDRLAFRQVQADTGITAQYRDMGGTSEAVVGLTRGDVQLAQIPYRQLLDAISAGAPVKAVLGSNMSPELVLVGGPDVTLSADLRGKRADTGFPGGGGDVLLDDTLDRAGLTRDDVKVSYLDESSTRAAALASGRIDAAILDESEYELLRHHDKRQYTVLARAVDVFPRIPQLVWAVDESWADEHDGVLKSVVDSLVTGYEDVYTTDGKQAWLTEARRTLLEGKDAEVAGPVYDFYRSVDFWPTGTTEVTEAQHASAVEDWIAHEQIERPVSFDDAWLPGYWADAAD